MCRDDGCQFAIGLKCRVTRPTIGSAISVKPAKVPLGTTVRPIGGHLGSGGWPVSQEDAQYAFPIVAAAGFQSGIEAKASDKCRGQLALVEMIALFSTHGLMQHVFLNDGDSRNDDHSRDDSREEGEFR